MTLDGEGWFNPSSGEEVLWYGHPSIFHQLPRVLTGVVFGLVFAGVAVFVYLKPWPEELVYGPIALVIMGFVFAVYTKLEFNNTYYVITTKRVIKKTGIIGRDSSSKPHREIVRVDVKVSIADALISSLTTSSIGDIIVRTADDTGERFTLDRVADVRMAESYLERLTGTGPDSPAQYGADEDEVVEHIREANQKGSAEQPDPANDESDAAVTESTETEPPKQPEQDPIEESDPVKIGVDEDQDEETFPTTDPPEQAQIDSDRFEPSDKA